MPNLGIASIGANIDETHDVYIIDFVRKRRGIRKYLKKTLGKIIALIKQLLPKVKIVIGGYHTTLMYKEIAKAPESRFIDFMVRGEGEMAFHRLTAALEGKDRLEEIPVERVLSDLDDIYYNRKTRWVFIVDDNMVLDPKRMMVLCDAIIQKKYKDLVLTGQAD